MISDLLSKILPQKKISHVLFDWDGTLGDSLKVWKLGAGSVLRSYGFSVTDEEMLSKKFEDFEITDWSVFFEDLYSQVTPTLATVPLQPQAKEILEVLKKTGIKIAVTTNCRRVVVENAINYHNLGSTIDLVLGESDVSNIKPDPEMLYVALKKLKGNKKSALLVGDSGSDILAGKKASIKTVCYLPENNTLFHNKEELLGCNPDFVISELVQIKNLLV